MFLLLLLTACNPFAVDVWEVYYIQKGHHYADRVKYKVSPVYNECVEFVFYFNDTHLYSDELQTDDINKLYGITSPKIHENSARFGWRNIKGDTIEVFAYWYRNGVRGFKLLGRTTPYKQDYYKIDVTGHRYTFQYNGTVFVVENTKNIAAFRAFPYFGGDEPAPHYMFFKITEL